MSTGYLHTMVRIRDIDESLRFYCDLLGLEVVRRVDREADGYSLIFVAAPGQHDRPVELTFNHGSEEVYEGGRNFGHLAFAVDDIYEMCDRLRAAGVAINRPPRDGRMAFVKSPDGISIELLQRGDPLPKSEPWESMGNTGTW